MASLNLNTDPNAMEVGETPASSGKQPPQRPNQPGKQPRKQTVPRKKNCNQCSRAKQRCDLQLPACARCVTRGWPCQYPPKIMLRLSTSQLNRALSENTEARLSESGGLASQVQLNPTAGTSINTVLGAELPGYRTPELPHLPTPESYTTALATTSSCPVSRAYGTAEVDPIRLDNIDLIATTDSTQIRNRWLESFIPSPDQVQKNLQPSVVNFASRILKSYPRMMLREGGLPPIIHPLQIHDGVPLPLAHCVSLVRLWEGRVGGSEQMIMTTVKNEMERLMAEHETYDQVTLLAAFQAYFLYTSMALFSDIGPLPIIDRSSMINLQELASRVSMTGLVSSKELSRTRPNWESWVVAAAKRRTLFAMYLLDNLYNHLHNIPAFVGVELTALPATGSKHLWVAKTRVEWEREYDIYLGRWDGGELELGELWKRTGGEPERKGNRIDRWVEEVDEFGMMLFTTTLLIHGC